VLDNIINQETDPDKRLLKMLQKEAIYGIKGSTRIEFVIRITALTPFSIKDTYAIPKIKEWFEELAENLGA
jgi:DNA-binding NtrC family response regulator